MDQDGVRISDQDFHEQNFVINFIFTRCTGSCPLETADLSAVQKSLPRQVKERVRFISVSVDAANDRPATLKAFAQARGADLRYWSFLTGSEADLKRLREKYDVMDVGRASDNPIAHSTDIRVFNASGKMLQRYAGVPLDRERLVREITLLASAPASTNF